MGVWCDYRVRRMRISAFFGNPETTISSIILNTLVSFVSASRITPSAMLQSFGLIIRTGEHDNHRFIGWPGKHLGVRGLHGSAALLSARTTEMRRRTPHAVAPNALAGLDVEAFARTKLAPMVRGIFPRSEQEAVSARNGWKRILTLCGPL
jgi:hypothetical protein